MMNTELRQINNLNTVETRWKDLYRIGAISSIAVAALILFAIIAFFIWRYEPGLGSAVNAFKIIQKDTFGGLIALDLVMLLIVLATIIPFLALYFSLKEMNESFAIIALVLGLISIISCISARPLVEWVTLTNKFAITTNESIKNQYLAAGETLKLLFNGTSWVIYIVLTSISSIIFSLLMFKSKIYTKTCAWVGVIVSICGLSILIPAFGILALFSTLGSIIWFILIARSLLCLGWSK